MEQDERKRICLQREDLLRIADINLFAPSILCYRLKQPGTTVRELSDLFGLSKSKIQRIITALGQEWDKLGTNNPCVYAESNGVRGTNLGQDWDKKENPPSSPSPSPPISPTTIPPIIPQEKDLRKCGKENSRNSQIRPNEDYIIEGTEEAWNLWLQYKSQIGKPYKSAVSRKVAYNKAMRLCKTPSELIEIVNQSLENNWQGLFELKQQVQNNGQTTHHNYTQADFIAKWTKRLAETGGFKNDNEIRNSPGLPADGLPF